MALPAYMEWTGNNAFTFSDSTTGQTLGEEENLSSTNVLYTASLLKTGGGADALMELIKCCICRHAGNPRKVATCVQGHTICGNCIIKAVPKNRCPKALKGNDAETCGVAICRYKSPIYSYLYNNSWFKCCFAENGCTKMPLGSNLRMHQLNCAFRPTLKCVFSHCPDATVAHSRYVDHLKLAHNVGCLPPGHIHIVRIMHERLNRGLPDDILSYRWSGCLYQIYGLDFIVAVEEEPRSLHIWVTLANEDKFVENRKFECRTQIDFSKEGIDQQYIQGAGWGGEVTPLDDNIDKHVADGGDTFMIPKKVFVDNYLAFNKEDILYYFTIGLQILEKFEDDEVTRLELLAELEKNAARVSRAENAKLEFESRLQSLQPQMSMEESKLSPPLVPTPAPIIPPIPKPRASVRARIAAAARNRVYGNKD